MPVDLEKLDNFVKLENSVKSNCQTPQGLFESCALSSHFLISQLLKAPTNLTRTLFRAAVINLLTCGQRLRADDPTIGDRTFGPSPKTYSALFNEAEQWLESTPLLIPEATQPEPYNGPRPTRFERLSQDE